MTRTSAYRFTTTDTTDSRIADLRVKAKLMGLEQKAEEIVAESKGKPKMYTKRFRVVVRARLGKDSPFASLYRKRTKYQPAGQYYRWSSQCIRAEHGSRFDVYLQEVLAPTKYSKYYRR
jgi:hypothetical protein